MSTLNKELNALVEESVREQMTSTRALELGIRPQQVDGIVAQALEVVEDGDRGVQVVISRDGGVKVRRMVPMSVRTLFVESGPNGLQISGDPELVSVLKQTMPPEFEGLFHLGGDDDYDPEAEDPDAEARLERLKDSLRGPFEERFGSRRSRPHLDDGDGDGLGALMSLLGGGGKTDEDNTPPTEEDFGGLFHALQGFQSTLRRTPRREQILGTLSEAELEEMKSSLQPEPEKCFECDEGARGCPFHAEYASDYWLTLTGRARTGSGSKQVKWLQV